MRNLESRIARLERVVNADDGLMVVMSFSGTKAQFEQFRREQEAMGDPIDEDSVNFGHIGDDWEGPAIYWDKPWIPGAARS